MGCWSDDLYFKTLIKRHWVYRYVYSIFMCTLYPKLYSILSIFTLFCCFNCICFQLYFIFLHCLPILISLKTFTTHIAIALFTHLLKICTPCVHFYAVVIPQTCLLSPPLLLMHLSDLAIISPISFTFYCF